MWRKLRAARRSKKPAKLWKKTESNEVGLLESTPVTPNVDIEPFSDGSGDSDHIPETESLVPEPRLVERMIIDAVETAHPADLGEEQNLNYVDYDVTEHTPPEPKPDEETGSVESVQENEEYRSFDNQDPALEPVGEQETFDEDKARQQAYVHFVEGQEDPEDYTSGPARVVLASDGVNPWVALLMTMDMSENVRRAVQAQRDYAFAEAVSTEEEMVKSRFEWNLRSAIQRHTSRIEMLQEEDPEEAAVEINDLEKELEKLQMLLAETTSGLMGMKARLQTKADNLREIQANLTHYLEEAFICAQIVQPPVEQVIPEIPELEVEEEYKKLCKGLAESQGDELEMASAPSSLHSCREHMEEVELSPEDQQRQNLIDAFYAADVQLQIAQQEFDNKDENLATELGHLHDALARGEENEGDTQEVFDLRWYTVFQDITRALIDAEEAFAAAKAAVLEAGLSIANDDAESGFGDLGSNGYAEEFEARMVATTSVPQVEGWLDSVADEASADVDAQTDVDLDEWDAENVEIGDSQSCVEYEHG
ncbi:hypothetical protein LTR17_025234 [Elasticomyces elasticus]|nr:hypothetical protein LTR17_025234 [Elasticomyces elasticus]